MFTLPKEKLSVVVIGNNHGDPVPYQHMLKNIEELYNNTIPCVFLEEEPSDQKLTDLIRLTEKTLEDLKKVKKLAPDITKYYIKNKELSYPYLPLSAWESIEIYINSVLSNFNISLKKGEMTQLVLDFYRENAYVEEIKFYKQLQQFKIPYAGIEAEAVKRKEQLIDASSSDESALKAEPIRIETMMNNIFQHGIKQLPHGGVIFIYVGRTHSHRLGANILKDYPDVWVNTLNLLSPYISSEYSEGCHKHALQLTSKVDSLEIKKIYESLLCPTIMCQEKSAPELTILCNKLVQRHSLEQKTNAKLNNNSLFKLPNSLECQKLLHEVKKVQPQNKSVELIISDIENGAYSTALHKACVYVHFYKNYDLVKMFVQYANELSIDLKEASTWVDSNTIISAPVKDKIKTFLIEKEAMHNFEKIEG